MHVPHRRQVVAVGEDAGRAWVHLDDGAWQVADLVVGADGIGLVVREAVAGSDIDPTYAGYVAWRALIPEQALSEAAAQTLSDRFAFYNMPGGQGGWRRDGPSRSGRQGLVVRCEQGVRAQADGSR